MLKERDNLSISINCVPKNCCRVVCTDAVATAASTHATATSEATARLTAAAACINGWRVLFDRKSLAALEDGTSGASRRSYCIVAVEDIARGFGGLSGPDREISAEDLAGIWLVSLTGFVL